MNHIVKFSNCFNNWSNALPLGNGVMGAMVFYEDGVLHIPVNHYEVYYYRTDEAFPEDMLENFCPPEKPGEQVHADYVQRAVRNQPPDGEPFIRYQHERTQKPNEYNVCSFSNSHPSTGELRFVFDTILEGGTSELTLDAEEAKVLFTLGRNSASVSLEIITARQDCILISVSEKKPKGKESLIKEVQLYYPACRDYDPPEITFGAPDETTAVYKVRTVFNNTEGDKAASDFNFAGALRAKSASLEMSAGNDLASVKVKPNGDSYELIFGIFTDLRYQTLPCLETMKSYEDTSALYKEHKKYWDEFYSRANISLPDRFLEKIWYINQYALDCCSGRGGVMKHQACGLNGLWDIRHPNLWGSLWYWDVNIQAAFAGVFSSNRLELGKVFSDGLRSWEKLAEQYADALHGLPGVSMDYPYLIYYCIWPWCASYLWMQYEYSLDEDYLRNEAYPLFLKICEFAVKLFKWDDERGCYSVYPDVSPEQGPYAHNTVSTVASVKYMLNFTLRSAEILGDTSALLEKIRELYEHLPEYPTCEDTKYGRRFKDSEDAPDNLWIRHPGMLMPVFPTGEIDINSDEEMRRIINSTINYLEDNCEIGVFQGSWLSAASSRLGDGQRALRLLYERGIDHMLRSNGLTAEATERFMNFCLIMRQPLYYPCMMEFTGEMLAAVNEMLLQSHNNIIRVFPAIPDGSMEYDRMLRRGHAFNEFLDRHSEYAPWKDVKFTNMLARGAFEVSAELAGGRINWVEIHSRAGGRARVTSPMGLDGYSVYCAGMLTKFEYSDGIISFDTEKGKRYIIKAAPEVKPSPIDRSTTDGIVMHTTYTKRRIFIGEDSNTACIKTFDDFIRSWYLGNVRCDNHTVYKFDFTENKGKDYGEYLPRQVFAAEPGIALVSLPFIPIGCINFTDNLGYGFADANSIRMESALAADTLFGDCAVGVKPNEFILELPRGRYEVMVVSGSEDHDTKTRLETENGYRTGGEVIPAGTYSAYVLPICAERDGKMRIRISTTDGYCWRMSCLLLNIVKGYGF